MRRRAARSQEPSKHLTFAERARGDKRNAGAGVDLAPARQRDQVDLPHSLAPQLVLKLEVVDWRLLRRGRLLAQTPFRPAIDSLHYRRAHSTWGEGCSLGPAPAVQCLRAAWQDAAKRTVT